MNEHIRWLEHRESKLRDLANEKVKGSEEWKLLMARIGELREVIENAQKILAS